MGRNSPRFTSQPPLLLGKLLPARFPRTRSLLRQHSLDSHLKRRSDGPVVGGAHFMPSVFALLDLAHAPIQHSITPGRRSFLLACIVLVRTDVVLVRRCKRDGGFIERAETEVWILPFGCEQ
jgi:hypothetical protein